MKAIDAVYLENPSFGSRSIATVLVNEGWEVNRKRVQRLMRLMGIAGVVREAEPVEAVAGSSCTASLGLGAKSGTSSRNRRIRRRASAKSAYSVNSNSTSFSFNVRMKRSQAPFCIGLPFADVLTAMPYCSSFSK
jgi:transposase InsO family protein